MAEIIIWKGVFYQHISHFNNFIKHNTIILCHYTIYLNHPTLNDKGYWGCGIGIYSNPLIKRIMFLNIKPFHFLNCKKWTSIIGSWYLKASWKCSCKVLCITCCKTRCAISIKYIRCFIDRRNSRANLYDD